MVQTDFSWKWSWSFWTSWFDTCIYCHPIISTIAQQCVCQRFIELLSLQQFAQLFKNAFVWIIMSGVWPILKLPSVETDIGTSSLVRIWFTRCRYQFKCAVQIKKTGWIQYITTPPSHPYSYNCNFFLFPYNSITLLKAQSEKYFASSISSKIRPFLTKFQFWLGK